MKRYYAVLLVLSLVLALCACSTGTDVSVEASEAEESKEPIVLSLTEDELYDKVKGAWAGQMYGVTMGWPTEFQYIACIAPASAVPDMATLDINHAFIEDDLYVELTYVDAMLKNGYDCSLTTLANAFAASTYPLDHANKQGRTNLQNGISAPDSGSYKYNYHCDDIDWQINADFVGTIYALDVNQAASRAFEIGHITNYGDGVYGGVYVAALHSAAYYAESVRQIIDDALAAIPEGTLFKQVQQDVLAQYDAGASFEDCWQAIQDKWGDTDRCLSYGPNTANIDAKLNSAYVTMGLLYGDGDLQASSAYALRCGQDSDCNPSTVAGVLGTFYGYEMLKNYFAGLDLTGTKFNCTEMTFDDAVNACVKMAKDFLGETLSITKADAVTVEYEQWPDMPAGEMSVSVSNGAVNIEFNAYDPSGIASYKCDMGDGAVYDAPVTAYKYAQVGTYTVTMTVTNNTGNSSVFKSNVTVTESYDRPEYKGYGNLAELGTIIATVTKPMGVGSQDLDVIRDGKYGYQYTGQYDTFAYSATDHEEYIGYCFGETFTFDKILFTEGMNFDDGGWFKNGSLRVQALVGGAWKDVNATVSPSYPISDSKSDFGTDFESYSMVFEPITASGIRIIGMAGGRMHFISVAELEVYGKK